MACKISIQNPFRYKEIPTTALMRRWAKKALQHATSDLHTTLEVCIRLVDENESATLNKTYRHKSGPTNILSFPLIDEKNGTYLGDIVLCVPLITQEAKNQEIALNAHWAHLIIHGVLHLLGFDHETDAQADKMETLEIRLLQDMGYANPYGEP